MTVRIETGIPIPPARLSPRKGKSKYPFLSMKVGDTFFMPGVMAASVQSMARRATIHLGWRFTTRAVTEGGKNGARCWREA